MRYRMKSMISLSRLVNLVSYVCLFLVCRYHSLIFIFLFFILRKLIVLLFSFDLSLSLQRVSLSSPLFSLYSFPLSLHFSFPFFPLISLSPYSHFYYISSHIILPKFHPRFNTPWFACTPIILPTYIDTFSP